MALTKITTSVVAVNSLTTANIADNSIDATKIASNSILTRHIDDAQITTDQILDGTIATADIADDAVTEDKLANAINTSIAAKLPLAGGTLTGNIAHASDFTIDVGGNIILDADGGDIKFLDDGTETLRYSNSGSGPQFFSPVADKDIIFKGKDGSSTITALTLDMSDAGTAIFNHDIVMYDNANIFMGNGYDLRLQSDGTNGTISAANGNLNLDVAGDIILDSDNGVWRFKDAGTTLYQIAVDGASVVLYTGVSDADMVFKGNDGGSTVTALTLDMSNAGKATFNSNVEVGAAVELTTAGKPIQVAGSSSNAWALGSSGGENAPGTASTTFAFHRWNGSAWNNAVEIDTNGIITPDTGTGGIKLGGAAAANLLDDYEEGTFDPTLTTDSGSVTMYTSYNTLAYTKVGRVVNITGMLALTSVSSPTGQIIFGNLPFTMANLTNRAGQARPTIHIYASGSGAPTQNKYYPAFIAFNEGSTSGLIVATYNATHDDSIADWFAAGSDIFANFSYITA